MSHPSLLRRAAAATLGGNPRRLPATALVARELPLARRAVAAVIGIRSYRTATPATAHQPGKHSSAPMRTWEVRRPRTRRPATSPPTLDGEDAASHAVRPPSSRRRTPPARAVEASDPPTVIIAAGDDDTVPPPRPRTWLALAATVGVLATALSVLAYHHTEPDHPQPPSHVITGDVPRPYVGTWEAVTNADGANTRTLVIKQGRIGDTVMTLTADGPTPNGTYRCVFEAALAAVAPTSIRIGESTVAAGDTSYCKPGDATTITLKNHNTLSRTNGTNNETLTYTRAS